MTERKTLKISPEVYEKLEQNKRDTETWNSYFERLLEATDSVSSPEFEYDVTSNTELITLKFYPREKAAFDIGNSGGENRSIPTLYTGNTMITNESIKPELEDLEGVTQGGLTHSGAIEVKIPRETDTDVMQVVDEAFSTVQRVIQEKEDPVERVKQAASKYAVPRKTE